LFPDLFDSRPGYQLWHQTRTSRGQHGQHGLVRIASGSVRRPARIPARH